MENYIKQLFGDDTFEALTIMFDDDLAALSEFVTLLVQLEELRVDIRRALSRGAYPVS